MSLDIYLEENSCPCCKRGDLVFEWNVTHNLGVMAVEAEIYDCLLRAPEYGLSMAGQLISPLRTALAKTKKDPDRFRALNPPNGWGSYAVFVPRLEDLLRACERYPSASVRVSR